MPPVSALPMCASACAPAATTELRCLQGCTEPIELLALVADAVASLPQTDVACLDRAAAPAADVEHGADVLPALTVLIGDPEHEIALPQPAT